MPKQSILNNQAGYEELSVHWGTGGVVQVRADDGLEDHYFDLDRNEINRMIKALRRARDTTYGKDA